MGKKEDFSGKLTAYLKDKGFVYGPEPEIYGGISGFYAYGPLGKRLKNNVEKIIRNTFNSTPYCNPQKSLESLRAFGWF